jgi:hypothetical protein
MVAVVAVVVIDAGVADNNNKRMLANDLEELLLLVPKHYHCYLGVQQQQ